MVASRRHSSLWLKTSFPMPPCSDGDTALWNVPSFGGHVKPRSRLIKTSQDTYRKEKGSPPVSWLILPNQAHSGPLIIPLYNCLFINSLTLHLKQVCGERSGRLAAVHHPRGATHLLVVEVPPSLLSALGYLKSAME